MPRTILKAILFILLSACVYAQKSERNSHLEIIPVQTEKKALNEIEYPSTLHNLSWSVNAAVDCPTGR